jgi:hypothetical protein
VSVVKQGRQPLANKPTTMSDEEVDEEMALVQKYDAEFGVIMSDVSMKKKLMPTDPENQKVQVSHFGEIREKIEKFMYWTKKKLPKDRFYECLAGYGDQLAQANEYTGAKLFCYDVCCKDLDKEADISLFALKVRSIYGRALCSFEMAVARDAGIKYPQTLTLCQGTLVDIQGAMGMVLKGWPADKHDDLAFLIFNGTVHLYRICEPMLSLGFAEHVVEYLTWSVLSMEAVVNLSTLKYLRWRTRIYSTICHCYEDMAFKSATDKAKHLATAQAVVERAGEKLDELIQLELEDPPIPPAAIELMDEIRSDMNILLFKFKSLAAPKDVPAIAVELFKVASEEEEEEESDKGEDPPKNQGKNSKAPAGGDIVETPKEVEVNKPQKMRAILESMFDPNRRVMDKCKPDGPSAPAIMDGTAAPAAGQEGGAVDDSPKAFYAAMTTEVMKLIAEHEEVLTEAPMSQSTPGSTGRRLSKAHAKEKMVEDEAKFASAVEMFPLTMHFALLKQLFAVADWISVKKLLDMATLRLEVNRLSISMEGQMREPINGSTEIGEKGAPSLAMEELVVMENEHRLLQAAFDLEVGPDGPKEEEAPEPVAVVPEPKAAGKKNKKEPEPVIVKDPTPPPSESDEDEEPEFDPLSERVPVPDPKGKGDVRDVPILHLHYMAQALQAAVKGSAVVVCKRRLALVDDIAVEVWKQYCAPMLSLLSSKPFTESLSSGDNQKMSSIVIELMIGCHVIFSETKNADTLMRCQLALQLALMLEETQDDLRMAVQVLRYTIQNINDSRAKLVSFELHRPGTTIDDGALTRCAFTTEIDDRTEQAGRTRVTGGFAESSDNGVYGAGSKLHALEQAVAAIHVDMISTLMRIELVLGARLQGGYIAHKKRIADAKAAAKAKAAAAITGDDKKQKLKNAATTIDLHATKKKALEDAAAAKLAEEAEQGGVDMTLLSAPAESRLMMECRTNGYWKSLLLAQAATMRRKGSKEQEQLLLQAAGHLRDAQKNEDSLLAQAAFQGAETGCPAEVGVESCPVANSDAWDGIFHPSLTPPAPLIISRGATHVTIKPKLWVPKAKTVKGAKHHAKPPKVAYFRVFGKPAGAGTSVSLNNTQYPGTGTNMPAEAIELPDTKQHHHHAHHPHGPTAYRTITSGTGGLLNCGTRSADYITVGGLLPNEVYVFAVAAYDVNGSVIGGIGKTSVQVEACSPLPLLLCWGYLAKQAHELGHHHVAKNAAMMLYRHFVDDRNSTPGGKRPQWAVNPQLAHALRWEKVSRASQPLLQCFVQILQQVLVEGEGGVGNDVPGWAFPLYETEADECQPKILVNAQRRSLLMVKKMVMAAEVAARIEEHGLLMDAVCCAYNAMLPVLRLRRRGPFILQSMVTLHQAMQLVPLESWDTEIKLIFAALCYEIVVTSKEVKEEAAGEFTLIEQGPRSMPNIDAPKFENLEQVDEDNAGIQDPDTIEEVKPPAPPKLLPLSHKAWPAAPEQLKLTDAQAALEELMLTMPEYQDMGAQPLAGASGMVFDGAADLFAPPVAHMTASDIIVRPSTAVSQRRIHVQATRKARAVAQAKALKAAEKAAAEGTPMSEVEEVIVEAAEALTAEQQEEADADAKEALVKERKFIEALLPEVYKAMNDKATPAEEAFKVLSTQNFEDRPFMEHPRYLELMCKVARFCVARSGVEKVAKEVLAIKPTPPSRLGTLGIQVMQRIDDSRSIEKREAGQAENLAVDPGMRADESTVEALVQIFESWSMTTIKPSIEVMIETLIEETDNMPDEVTKAVEYFVNPHMHGGHVGLFEEADTATIVMALDACGALMTPKPKPPPKQLEDDDKVDAGQADNLEEEEEEEEMELPDAFDALKIYFQKQLEGQAASGADREVEKTQQVLDAMGQAVTYARLVPMLQERITGLMLAVHQNPAGRWTEHIAPGDRLIEEDSQLPRYYFHEPSKRSTWTAPPEIVAHQTRVAEAKQAAASAAAFAMTAVMGMRATIKSVCTDSEVKEGVVYCSPPGLPDGEIIDDDDKKKAAAAEAAQLLKTHFIAEPSPYPASFLADSDGEDATNKKGKKEAPKKGKGDDKKKGKDDKKGKAAANVPADTGEADEDDDDHLPESLLPELELGIQPPPKTMAKSELLWLAELHSLRGLVPLQELAGSGHFLEQKKTSEGPATDLTWDLGVDRGGQSKDMKRALARRRSSMGLSGKKGQVDTLKSQTSRPQSGNRRTPRKRTRIQKTKGVDGSDDEFEEEEEALQILLREFSRSAVLARWGHCWSMVQNACYCVWNGIWAAWASPTDFIPTNASATGRSRTGGMLYEWRPLLECAESLLDMIEIMQRDTGLEVINRGQKDDGGEEEEDEEDDDIGVMNHTLITPAQAQGVNCAWVASGFVRFTVQVLCHVEEWAELVALAKRANALTGNVFAEESLPIVLHAQEERVIAMRRCLESSQDLLENRKSIFAAEQSKIKKKKTRLVIKEEVSPAQHVHRLQCEFHQEHLAALQDALAELEKERAELRETDEDLKRAKSGSLEALDGARHMLMDWRRKKLALEAQMEQAQAGLHFGFAEGEDMEVAMLAEAVERSYLSATTVLREKREFHANLLLVQALHELGDFHFALTAEEEGEKSKKKKKGMGMTSTMGGTWGGMGPGGARKPVAVGMAEVIYKPMIAEMQLDPAELRHRALCGLSEADVKNAGGEFAESKRRSAAATAWDEALDAIFHTLDARSMWRELLDEHQRKGDEEANGNSSKELDGGGHNLDGGGVLRSLGLWPCILAGIVLSKIAKHTKFHEVHQRTEACLMAARCLGATFDCSLPHPTRGCDLASYRAVDLWPQVDLFADPLRCQAAALLEAFRFVSETLIRTDNARHALPLLVAYEYLARERCLNLRKTIDARLLQVEALSQLGLFAEAVSILKDILLGVDLPDPLLGSTSSVKGLGPVKIAVAGDAVAAAAAHGLFHNSAAPEDEKNKLAVDWLCNIGDWGQTEVKNEGAPAAVPAAKKPAKGAVPEVTGDDASPNGIHINEILENKYGAKHCRRFELLRASLLAKIALCRPYPVVPVKVDGVADVQPDSDAELPNPDDPPLDMSPGAVRVRLYVAAQATNHKLVQAASLICVELEKRATIAWKGEEEEDKEEAVGDVAAAAVTAETAATAVGDVAESGNEDDDGGIREKGFLSLWTRCECLLQRASMRLVAGFFAEARAIVTETMDALVDFEQEAQEVVARAKEANGTAEAADGEANCEAEKETTWQPAAAPDSCVALGLPFWLRCRVVLTKCSLGQGQLEDALEQVELGINEAAMACERTHSRELRLLGAQAMIYLGKMREAESALRFIIKDSISDAKRDCEIYVVALILLAGLQRERSLSVGRIHSARYLHETLKYLTEAEAAVDEELTALGFIGSDVIDPPNQGEPEGYYASMVGMRHAWPQLGNLYLRPTETLARLKQLIAQALLEAPLTDGSKPKTSDEDEAEEQDEADAGVLVAHGGVAEAVASTSGFGSKWTPMKTRSEVLNKAATTLEEGLATLKHAKGTHFLPTLRVQMLLMLGRLRRLLLVEDLQGEQVRAPLEEVKVPALDDEGNVIVPPEGKEQEPKWVKLPETHPVGAVVELLMRAFQLCMSEGGHERSTMQSICLELVALYQAQLVEGLAEQHQLEAMFFLSEAAKCNVLKQKLAHNVQTMGNDESVQLNEENTKLFFGVPGEGDSEGGDEDTIERGIPSHVK